MIATKVAMQGKYSSTNTIKATAAGSGTSPFSAFWRAVLFSSASAPSSPAYITPSVLTTSSLAPTPASRPTSIFQLKPRGSRTGSTVFPSMPM